MVLVCSYRLRCVQAKRIRRTGSIHRIQVWIIGKEGVGVAVHGRCPWPGMKLRLAGGIRRTWVGSKIMIERNILLKDNHQVLDGSCSRPSVLLGQHRRNIRSESDQPSGDQG